ncbi:MAG: hypothetical protein HN392_01630 [Anaerolineae bacterium]|jgi:uncharacterized membrane protein (UPF0127 family)|nr:hypothetical protein [Anaerolineae bacterium]MBT7075760.1 hypothetical protein [Anaerolineae bacterium]MBT7783927.1 hypothetical protein [Anaerolineae bacterium]
MSHIIHVNNLDFPSQTPLQIKYCDSFLCRLRGLTFTSEITPASGLLLVQKADSRLDASIHMLGVSYDLAVIWINSAMQVVDKVLAKSWHLSYAPKKPAQYILEIHPERLSEFKIGDKVQFEDV